MQPPSSGPSAFAALRQLVRQTPRRERCELCGTALATKHEHLVEPPTRRLLCACGACAILFNREGARYQRVPRRVEYLPDLRLTDAQWEELRVPINLAFFFHSTPAGRVVALYPSPAGATESLLSLEAWQKLEDDNPILRELQPDVEALLVNRMGQAHDHYLAPIDQCYRLVGLIRSHWRGLAGGTEVWTEIARFFDELKRK